MTADKISPLLRDFIQSSIDSVGTLEALLVFTRNPAAEWCAESLCKELKTNVSWCTKQIEWLLSKSLIKPGAKKNSYQYSSRDPGTDTIILELMQVYSERRVSIINLISDNLIRVRQFANAFIFRKEEDEND